MIGQQVSGAVLGLALSMAAASPAGADEVTVASDPAGAVPLSPTEFIPPDDGYDWLRLVSGEWLKGELIGLFDGEVEFDSEILDKLVIDAEDIRDVRSSRRFGISVRGEEMLIGTVSMHGDRVIVDTGSQRYQLPRQDLVRHRIIACASTTSAATTKPMTSRQPTTTGSISYWIASAVRGCSGGRFWASTCGTRSRTSSTS
jgi:hypothetical protein